MDVILQFIRQFIRQYRVPLIVGGVLGLILGLIFGWVIWPVQWSNATPSHLRSDFQTDYILWVTKGYAENGDLEWARSKLGVEFWEEGALAAKLAEVEAGLSGEQVVRLRALAHALEGGVPAGEVSPQEPPAEPEAGGGSSPLMICGVALLVVACVGGVIFLFTQMRAQRAGGVAVERKGGVPRERVAAEVVSWGPEGPPLAQFFTAYELGDDHYDPSFSVELDNGEFMGECGVGVSETIGVGTPNKVTAFEVWLFDKSDIRTVTKVLMSDYAFHDEALRTKLAPKGEPMLVETGKDVVLNTKTLRLRARVVESEYGMDNLPSNSFFKNLTIELAIWVLSEEEGAQSSADGGDFAGPSTL